MKGAFALLLAAALTAAAPPAPRLVSLVPSFTEDLCAIGAAKQLVGVSRFSSDIPCARGLPRVNDASSINAEAIVALHPGAVVAIPSQRGMTAALVRAGIDVEYLPNDSYQELFGDVTHLGAIAGRERQAARLVAALRAQTAALERSEHLRRRPRIFFVAQAQPLWTIGPSSYIASLVALAGGRLATGSLQLAYAQYSAEALLRDDPDAIVATKDAQLQDVLGREPWRSLRAVKQHHVFILDDSSLLVRPGPRYNQGLRWLIQRFSSL